MTIDEAIADVLHIAEGQDKCAEISVSCHAKESIRACAARNRQLAEWLTELKGFRSQIGMILSDSRAAIDKRDKMLRDTVKELCEAKWLLKSAAKIVNSSLCCDDDLCSECVHSEECKYSVDYDRCFEWKYKNTEEYKKLIGGSENG